MGEKKLSYEDVQVGDEAPVISHTLTRTDLVRYAGASGDFNPMHTDEVLAVAAGQPSVFGHGMFSMGILATAITRCRQPVAMATAMRHAVIAGYEARRAGRIPRRRLARVLGFTDSPTVTATAAFDDAMRRWQSDVRLIHERLFFRPLLEAFAALEAPVVPEVKRTRFGSECRGGSLICGARPRCGSAASLSALTAIERSSPVASNRSSQLKT